MTTRSEEALRKWQNEFSPATLKTALEEVSMNIEARLSRELRLLLGAPAAETVSSGRAREPVTPDKEAANKRPSRPIISDTDDDEMLAGVSATAGKATT